jgi:RNase P/RNase MRP subunit p29
MIRNELLGQQTTVVQANNSDLTGLSGEIIDETQHTLRIKMVRGEKTVLKAHATFKMGSYIINGTNLKSRAHERTKIKLTQWHKTINQ